MSQSVTGTLSRLFEVQMAKGKVNNPDMLARYSPTMEVQINVAADDGRQVDGKRNTWENDHESWWHIRIPKKAMTDNPEWHDYILDWSLAEHAEAIGMTGWDWANKRSKWVGFDFDAITGHADGVGVSPSDLQTIQEAACNIPWVEVRLSTRGAGIHLYVYFYQDPADPGDLGVRTNNHNEHAALARCVLTMMSKYTGFDFSQAIDVCGGNMWVWHRGATPENHGLSKIQAATATLTEDDLPINWRDNIEVVTRKRTKVRVRGVDARDEEQFNMLANSRSAVTLTDSHNDVIDALEETGFTTIWHHDYRLIQTHTRAFQKIMDESPGKYDGCFATLSDGTDPGKPNCFAFPLPGKGFRVFRFGRGGTEADTWERGDNGWLSAYFDRMPTFQTASRAAGGSEMENGGFHFDNLSEALAAVDMLGADINIDKERFGTREAEFNTTKQEGRLVVRMKATEGESKPAGGWVRKRGWWEKVVHRQEEDASLLEGFDRWDSIVRCTKSIENESAGWYILDNSGEWVSQPKTDVKSYLARADLKLKPKDAEAVLGSSVNSAWKLVNMPFQDEYPGQRQWNLRAAQWKYNPAIIEDGEPIHPHWDMVLNHIGDDLNVSLRDDPWARRHNITSGRQYLQLWIACLLRFPFDKLPFLFLYGEENCGKSTLWQAIDRLVTSGVMDAKFAFRDSDFNGELENCVLAVIEEINPHGKDIQLARARMKDWTTNDWLGIRRMRRDAYRVRNTLHFIQTSNYIDHCLMALGDTRGMIINVRSLTASGANDIPHAALMQHLDDEAPHFMRTLCDMEIPAPESRLRIECISTESKRRYITSQCDELERFLFDRCQYKPRSVVLWADFYNRFLESLPEDERARWSKKRVSAALPDRFPTGKYGGQNQTHIGNMVIDQSEKVAEADLKLRPFISYKSRLRTGETSDE